MIYKDEKQKYQEMENLNIETIKHKSSQLLGDLNMKKGIKIERKKEIKITLEKLNTPKTIVDTIRKSIISKKIFVSNFKT